MLNNNPFSLLADAVSPLAMQGFIIAMVLLIAFGTMTCRLFWLQVWQGSFYRKLADENRIRLV